MDSLKILSPTYALDLTTSASSALQLIPNTPTRAFRVAIEHRHRHGGDYIWHHRLQYGRTGCADHGNGRGVCAGSIDVLMPSSLIAARPTSL
jgi:hypothetical protein